MIVGLTIYLQKKVFATSFYRTSAESIAAILMISQVYL